jgi:hypothetical protein
MALRISTPVARQEKVLVNAGALAASSVVYVRADCERSAPATYAVDWRVKSDKASTMLFYRSRAVVNGATLTLADATRVDVDDTMILNGITLTAKASGTVALTWVQGQSTTDLDAVNLAACITANVDGVKATAAAHVITLSPVKSATYPQGAPVLLFGQGTSDAAEIAFADTTLANLIKDGAISQVTGAVTSTTAGTVYQQRAYGYPYCYIGYTDTSAAATALTIGATLIESV